MIAQWGHPCRSYRHRAEGRLSDVVHVSRDATWKPQRGGHGTTTLCGEVGTPYDDALTAESEVTCKGCLRVMARDASKVREEDQADHRQLSTHAGGSGRGRDSRTIHRGKCSCGWDGGNGNRREAEADARDHLRGHGIIPEGKTR